MTLKTHTIGDHAVEMSDAAVVAVKGLQRELGTAIADALAKDRALNEAKDAHAAAIRTKDEAAANLVRDHEAAIRAKDGEIATRDTAIQTKDGEIVALKQQVTDAELTPAKLDAAVNARTKVIADAKRIAGDKLVTDGKTEAQIRREAVTAHLGDAAKDLSDEAIGGAFMSYAGKGAADPLTRAIADARPVADADDPHVRRRRALGDAWKSPQPTAAH